MSATSPRRLVHILNGATLGTLVVSCAALLGAFHFDEPLLAAFCLGASATCLAGGVLLLSYAVFVRGRGGAETAEADPAGLDPIGSLGALRGRLMRRVSIDLVMNRETGRRLRGSLRVRNNTHRPLTVEEVTVTRPTGARVSADAGLDPAAVTPVTVGFDVGANRPGVEVAPGAASNVEVFVLLPDGAFGGRRLEIEVALATGPGTVDRRALRQRIPG